MPEPSKDDPSAPGGTAPSLTRYGLESKLIAKAWKDPAYRARLLEDPKSAIAEETAQPLSAETHVVVLEELGGKLFPRGRRAGVELASLLSSRQNVPCPRVDAVTRKKLN